jgi:hypothetical protein
VKEFVEISWKTPWIPVNSQVEILALQHRIETEIRKAHPLFDKDAQVIGRRIDNDDVVVKLRDGKYTVVHLVWGEIPVAESPQFPSTVLFASLDDFLSVMDADALPYTEDEAPRTSSTGDR